MVDKHSGWRWLHWGPIGVFWLLTWWLALWVCRVDAQTLPLERIKLPPGFEISLYASGVKNARSMTLSPNGMLFVGTRSAGKVYAVVDRNGDGKADEVITLARGLNSPNGVAFRDGALYVAEINRVLRFDDVERRLTSSSQPVVVNDKFPKDGHHGWKFIRFGPDGLCMCRLGRHAIFASAIQTTTPSSCACDQTGQTWRPSPVASAIPLGLTGTPRPRISGSLIMGAIG